MVKCEVCGSEFNNITWKHLSKHNLTVDQYKTQYPTAVLQSDETAKKRREHAIKTNATRIGVKRSSAVIEKIKKSKATNPITAWNKGIPRTTEQNTQLADKRKQQFASGEVVHWNTGRNTPESTRAKISQSLLDQCLTLSDASRAKREQTIQQKKLSGWIHPSSEKISKYALTQLNDIEWLTHKHVVEQLTMKEIALLLDVDVTTVHKRFQLLNIPVHRFPASAGEREIVKFLQDQNIQNIVTNTRTIIPPLELDVYLPDHNIAIEYCGLYWHSHFHKPNNYHLTKLKECEKKGIRLITIFEDEWIHKQSTVEHKLLSILGLDNRPVVFARTCTINVVSTEQKRDFLDQNHIQGDGPGSIHYGLFSANQLVAVMSFIKQEHQHILNRYATSVRVVGGFSKLLTYFKRSNPLWKSIISFADRRWSTGELYSTTGWTLDHILVPDYTYVVQNTRVHKFNYRRSKLPALLDKYDPALSETQNTEMAGIPRIYNCGLLRFQLTNHSFILS